MKLQLIQPPIGKFKTNSRTGSYMPLGLVSMATYAKNQIPSLEIEILDGEMLSFEEIIAKMDAEFIGINTNTITYPIAVEIANIAKLRGSYVIFGGVYATAMAETILLHRKEIVDSIVTGYGEKPLVDILKGNRERIIRNTYPDLDCFSSLDRSFLNIEDYISVFRNNHPSWNYRATNIFTNVGCYWREFSNGGCIFCSRSGDYTKFKNPKLVWSEIEALVTEYQIDYFVDFSDTIIQNVEWLEELVKNKPSDLNPKWHIFSRADEINEEVIPLLKKLNCDHVFIGLESGDWDIYKKTNKGGGNPEENILKVKILSDNGISTTPSYVTALPGETESSLKKTLEHANTIKQLSGFEEIFCCELIPFPGSKAFSMLNKLKPFTSDILEVESLKKQWAKNFCNVDFNVIEYFTGEILKLGEYTITIREQQNNSNTLCRKNPNNVSHYQVNV
jgi:radical SAM superfamily enzyme YgiQ (UPF0313 family)